MNSDDYEVIDNFLDETSFAILKSVMMEDEFPWFWNDAILDTSKTTKDQYQFTHAFYKNHSIHSSYFDIVRPIVEKINPIAIMRIKANLNPRTENIIEHGYHIDLYNAPTNHRTSVFYVNTNNGYTKFEDGTKVESVENRLISFKTPIRHTGSTCNDVNRRVVINFNYII
jgi:hypothetical protein